jgi:hypothetical protein
VDLRDEMDREDLERLADLIVEQWDRTATVGPHDPTDPVRDSVLRTIFTTWGLLWYGTRDERVAARRALGVRPEDDVVAG